IPTDEFTRVVRADPDRRGLLYAGTEKAIYYSLDDGKSWSSLQLNLPVSPITDLAIKEKELIVATQGRGYWILDDLNVLHQIGPEATAADAHLYAPRDSYRLTAGGRSENPVNAGTNPPIGVVLHYALAAEPSPDTEITLSVYEDRSAEPIWTWTRELESDEEEETESSPNDPPDLALLSTEQGLNRFVWDLRYPGMERFDDLIMWADMREGPKAVPGTYRAELTVGSTVRDVEFEILADPRSTSSAAD
ncbi:MAG: glycosyl hydrolase, partial [Woeseiales bacterium]